MIETDISDTFHHWQKIWFACTGCQIVDAFT